MRANDFQPTFLIYRYTILLVGAMLASCSTTKHLPKGELLYTGTKAIEIIADTSSPLRNEAIDEAKIAFGSPPNNALFGSSRYRTPLPFGLWAYNAFVGDSVGLRHWLFRTFATQPIYISTVNPKLRIEVAKNTLHNYGYFNCDVGYKIDTLSNGRKGKISYTLQLREPWYYEKIEYKGFSPTVDSLIRSTWEQRILREGQQVSYATLVGERNRLFTLLRNQGFFYFRPEMITLFADTTLVKNRAQVLITPHPNLPEPATKPWYVGHTYLTINNARTPKQRFNEDTLKSSNITYIYKGKHIPIRPTLLASRIAYHSGDLYSATAQNTTQRDLNQLGILNAVNINYTPCNNTDTLNANINIQIEPLHEFSLEANLTTKSNNQVGPGITASLSRKNLLRMAEIIQLRLKGSYEWQTSHTLRHEGTKENSFELGAELSVSIPQLLFPGGYDYSYNRPVSTIAHTYVDWLHRGGFFRMLAFGGKLTYDFSSSEKVSHDITPFSLTFNTLEQTTQQFDSIMTANPAIGISFRDQFVPSLSYTFTYDNVVASPRHPSRVTLLLTSAGTITSLLYIATGHPWNEKDKSLLGTPYTQFIKGSIEACRYYNLTPRHTLATRIISGVIYAYGNSTTSPFSEQFYMGGADDLRAFPLRSIGPGGYHTTERYGYINHTGDIKLEANIEWRFPLAGQLNGALFADAGNVWLLRNDNDRPEGKLQWSTLGKATALGTGFGLRYNLRLLLLRFDIGIPIHIPYSTDKHGYYNVPNFIRGLCFHLGVGYPF